MDKVFDLLNLISQFTPSNHTRVPIGESPLNSRTWIEGLEIRSTGKMFEIVLTVRSFEVKGIPRGGWNHGSRKQFTSLKLTGFYSEAEARETCRQAARRTYPDWYLEKEAGDRVMAQTALNVQNHQKKIFTTIEANMGGKWTRLINAGWEVYGDWTFHGGRVACNNPDSSYGYAKVSLNDDCSEATLADNYGTPLEWP